MIEFQLQRLHDDAILPTRATPESLGLDLHALIIMENGRPGKSILPPRTSRPFHTGWAILPPQPTPELSLSINNNSEFVHSHNLPFESRLEGNKVWFLAVCSRSGLATKAIWVANAPGIIDPDYRGEICVILYNGGTETHYVQHGDRIGQLVAIQSSLATATIIADVMAGPPSARKTAGHGSTGQ